MSPEKLAQKYRKIIQERMPKIETAHNETGHGYISPNTKIRYKSTTFYTAIIKDPSLANYKMNRALRELREHIVKFGFDPAGLSLEEYLDRLIEKAKLAPQLDFETAGDFGEQAHSWREVWMREWINSGIISKTNEEIDKYPLPITEDVEVISACRAFKKFLKDTGAIPIFCELPLIDDKLELGGMADDGFIFPNPMKIETNDPILGKGYKIKYKPYFGFVDLKTSNQGKKPAYAYQVRGIYQRMFIRIFKIRPKKTWILHTSKEDGTYKLIDLTDMKWLEKDAQMLVHLSRSWDKVVEAFKPKIITI